MGESTDSYVAALHTLSKMGNYGLLLNSRIRDRIVVGISGYGTRKLLLQEQELTLLDVLTFVGQTKQQLLHYKQ